MKQQCLTIVILLISLLFTGIPAVAQPHLDRYNLLIIPVDFEDEHGQINFADLRSQWLEPLESFFSHVSNERSVLNTTLLQQIVRLGPRRLYHNCTGSCLRTGESCRNLWNSDSTPIDSAIASGLIEKTSTGIKPVGGGPDSVFDGIMFLTVIPEEPSKCAVATSADSCSTTNFSPFLGWTANNVSVNSDRSGHRYDMIHTAINYTAECAIADPPSYSSQHEIGHGIADHAAHPANYNNGYEMMDSCAICSPGIFTRLTRSALGGGFSRDWFEGWVAESKLRRFQPSTGGGTEVLAPIEARENASTAPQGLQVLTATSSSYLIECRKYLYPDQYIDSGLFNHRDEGVLILKVTPGANPETQVVRAPGDTRISPWLSVYQPGDVYTDTINDLSIRVGPATAEGCTVTVDYGPDAARDVPDVGIIPWLTPPMNSFETVDIWVDSSCNGYRDDDPTDPSRLRYGVRTDAERTVIGNGDDPCIDRENRVYARIRNLGGAVARDVRVRFEVTDPLGVGIRGATGWNEIGTVTKDDFATLTAIDPGRYVDVYVPWFPSGPMVTSAGRFRLHSCLRVIIEPVTGERVISNQDGDREQENIAWFEARFDTLSNDYLPIDREIFIVNEGNETREFDLVIDSQLPDDWDLKVADGLLTHYLAPAEVKRLPIHLKPTPSTPLGQSHFVQIKAYEKLPAYSPDGRLISYDNKLVGGVQIATQTVREQAISIDGNVSKPASVIRVEPSVIRINGALNPAHADVNVLVEFQSPDGERFPMLIKTNNEGRFEVTHEATKEGNWTIQAFWAGSMDYGSAETDEIVLMVGGESRIIIILAIILALVLSVILTILMRHR